MESYIIRHFPYYKSITKNIEYPNRTNKNDVDNIKIWSKNEKYINDYKKWTLSINYESKTKNKIKIGGNLHIKLGKKFILKHIVNYTRYYINKSSYYSYNYQDILFKDIDIINWDNYFLETELIYNNIDIENNIINENNKKILEYNNNVNEVIKNIQLLETWEQYVQFEENKYGISCIYNNIHRENNCFGLIKEYCQYKTCQCSSCENWSGCNNPIKKHYYYKCEKCDYESLTN